MKHLESAERVEEGSTATALDQSSVMAAALRGVEGATAPDMGKFVAKFEQRPVGFHGMTADRLDVDQAGQGLGADSSLAAVKGSGTADQVDGEETADGYIFPEATD
jgi:hypothetical protein